MNWGHGIIVGYTLFVGYILYFVFTSFTHDLDLVADDYYAQEVAFQDRIDETAHAAKWKDEIFLTKTESGIVLKFPEKAKQEFVEGTIYFFRPSDKSLDITIPISLDETGAHTIPYQLLKDGRYEAQIKWKGGTSNYFLKKSIFI